MPRAWGCSRRGWAQKARNQLSDYIEEVMLFPALQTWRQLGRVPGGQGDACSRQASWDRLSLPTASHTLILGWRVSALWHEAKPGARAVCRPVSHQG